ncbi:GPW/gp25 family protein [Danxiaibacter flavus]|uniref:GPW/gp25 family protein n=1 Tax=Danxiaibacter flavus TaxID=3049108 RepID=A0ABV3ZCQ6_9BACT|nr:GPW/gp25 family protein [Chitinophagaceae bacterium DXS]
MYYQIPFDFGAVMQGAPLPACDLVESIAQHVQLLVTTKCNENRFDRKYGNSVWDQDFERGLSDADWEDKFKTSLLSALENYEPRIFNINIVVKAEMVEKTWPLKKYTEIKKKVTVLINAQLVESSEKFSFKTELYISPMAVV